MPEPVEPPFDDADSRPKPLVFVLMPFATKLEGFYLAIRKACEITRRICERADTQIPDGTILNRIYTQIGKADLIIAETTGSNPNVMYEVGYAHALNKRVILLVDTTFKLPFDVAGYPCLVHKGSPMELEEKLPKWIPAVLERKTSTPIAASSLISYLGDQPLREGNFVRVIVPLGSTKRHLTVKFRFNVNNPTDTILDTENVEFGMIVSTEFCGVESRSAAPNGDLLANQLVRLPGLQNLHLFGGPVTGNSKRLLPRMWWNKDILFPVTDWPSLKEREIPATLRTFSETGSKDINFKLVFVETIPVQKAGSEAPPLPAVASENLAVI
jgi:hypothetical protein